MFLHIICAYLCLFAPGVVAPKSARAASVGGTPRALPSARGKGNKENVAPASLGDETAAASSSSSSSSSAAPVSASVAASAVVSKVNLPSPIASSSSSTTPRKSYAAALLQPSPRTATVGGGVGADMELDGGQSSQRSGGGDSVISGGASSSSSSSSSMPSSARSMPTSARSMALATGGVASGRGTAGVSLKLGIDVGLRRAAAAGAQGTPRSALGSPHAQSLSARNALNGSGGHASAAAAPVGKPPLAPSSARTTGGRGDSVGDDDQESDSDSGDGDDRDDCASEFTDVDSVAFAGETQWMYHVWVWMGGEYEMDAAFQGNARLFADTCAHRLAEHWRLPEDAPMTIHFEPAGKETDAFWKVFYLDTE